MLLFILGRLLHHRKAARRLFLLACLRWGQHAPSPWCPQYRTGTSITRYTLEDRSRIRRARVPFALVHHRQLVLWTWLCKQRWAACLNKTVLIQKAQDLCNLSTVRSKINISPLTCMHVDSSVTLKLQQEQPYLCIFLYVLKTFKQAKNHHACVKNISLDQMLKLSHKPPFLHPKSFVVAVCNISELIAFDTTKNLLVPAFSVHNQPINPHSSTRASTPELITQ